MCLGVPCHQAVFYKKELFNKFGQFNTRYRFNADAVMHYKTFCSDGTKWSYKNDIIAVYNDIGISSIETDSVLLDDIFEILYNSFLGKADKKILARVCLSNFFRFCLNNSPTVTWSYIKSIKKNMQKQ